MAEKQFLKVSPTLADNAQFKSVADIPSAMLKDEYTIQLFPGAYSAITVNGTDLTFEGVGPKDKVVVTGFNIGNTSTGNVTFTNMTIESTAAAQETINAGIEVAPEDATVKVICRDVVFATANIGVKNHGTGTVLLDRCDASGVDKAVAANAAMTFTFCELTPNAYGESNNAQIQACTVTSCYGSGSNGDITTETIIAAIS